MAKASQAVQAALGKFAAIVIEQRLFETRANDKNKEYLTTGTHHFSPIKYDFVGEDGKPRQGTLGGFICFNLNRIELVEEREANAAEDIRASLAKLSPEKRAAMLAELAAE